MASPSDGEDTADTDSSLEDGEYVPEGSLLNVEKPWYNPSPYKFVKKPPVQSPSSDTTKQETGNDGKNPGDDGKDPGTQGGVAHGEEDRGQRGEHVIKPEQTSPSPVRRKSLGQSARGDELLEHDLTKLTNSETDARPEGDRVDHDFKAEEKVEDVEVEEADISGAEGQCSPVPLSDSVDSTGTKSPMSDESFMVLNDSTGSVMSICSTAENLPETETGTETQEGLANQETHDEDMGMVRVEMDHGDEKKGEDEEKKKDKEGSGMNGMKKDDWIQTKKGELMQEEEDEEVEVNKEEEGKEEVGIQGSEDEEFEEIEESDEGEEEGEEENKDGGKVDPDFKDSKQEEEEELTKVGILSDDSNDEDVNENDDFQGCSPDDSEYVGKYDDNQSTLTDQSFVHLSSYESISSAPGTEYRIDKSSEEHDVDDVISDAKLPEDAVFNTDQKISSNKNVHSNDFQQDQQGHLGSEPESPNLDMPTGSIKVAHTTSNPAELEFSEVLNASKGSNNQTTGSQSNTMDWERPFTRPDETMLGPQSNQSGNSKTDLIPEHAACQGVEQDFQVTTPFPLETDTSNAPPHVPKKSQKVLESLEVSPSAISSEGREVESSEHNAPPLPPRPTSFSKPFSELQRPMEVSPEISSISQSQPPPMPSPFFLPNMPTMPRQEFEGPPFAPSSFPGIPRPPFPFGYPPGFFPPKFPPFLPGGPPPLPQPPWGPPLMTPPFSQIPPHSNLWFGDQRMQSPGQEHPYYQGPFGRDPQFQPHCFPPPYPSSFPSEPDDGQRDEPLDQIPCQPSGSRPFDESNKNIPVHDDDSKTSSLDEKPEEKLRGKVLGTEGKTKEKVKTQSPSAKRVSSASKQEYESKKTDGKHSKKEKTETKQKEKVKRERKIKETVVIPPSDHRKAEAKTVHHSKQEPIPKKGQLKTKSKQSEEPPSLKQTYPSKETEETRKAKPHIKATGVSGKRPSGQQPTEGLTQKDVRDKPLAKKQVRKGTTTEAKKVNQEPKPDDSFYVLVKGSTPFNTSADGMRNLLEAKSQKTMKENVLIFNREQTICLAEFTERPDMSLFQKRMSDATDQGMTVHELGPPTCVVVSSEYELSSYMLLFYYLENKGGAIKTEEQEYTEDGNCYIIRFCEPAAVSKLMQIPRHTVDNITLTISPFYTCEQGDIYDFTLHIVPIPEDVVVRKSALLINLLQRPCCETFMGQMESCYTEVAFNKEELVLRCTLTSRVKNCRQLVKTWKAKACEQLEEYIRDTVEEQTIAVESHVWEGFQQYLSSGDDIAGNEVLTSKDVATRKVFVAGLKSAVAATIVCLRNKLTSIDRKVRRKREIMPDLDHWKIDLLKKTGYFGCLENEFEDLNVSIEGGDTIELEGVPEDITSASIKLYQEFENIAVQKRYHDLSRGKLDFLRKGVTRRFIDEKLGETSSTIVWKVTNKEIVVYTSRGHIFNDNVWNVLEQSVKEKQIDLDRDGVALFCTKEWTEVHETISDCMGPFGEKVKLSVPSHTNMFISVISTDNIHQAVVEKVQVFLEENLIAQEIVPSDPISTEYVQRFLLARVGEISEALKSFKVTIKSEDNGLVVYGTKKGLPKARERLKEIIAKIKMDTKVFQKVGVEQVLIEMYEGGSLKEIEDKTRSLIKLPFDLEGSSVDAPRDFDHKPMAGATGGQGMDSLSISSDEVFTTKNGIGIVILKGLIGKQKGDVLVCSTHPKLDLDSGAASKSLLASGGSRLQDECKEQYPEGIKHGDVADISGGRLNCKRVYLTALPEWSPGDAIQVLGSVMQKCLERASKASYESIVFASMGTGHLSYPRNAVAEGMYDAVIKFDASSPGSSLKEVKFVLYDKDTATIQAFEAQEKRLKKGAPTAKYEYQANGIKIDLQIGSLEDQQVDAIFSTISSDLDLKKSGACRALLKKGGPALEAACKNHGGELQKGEVLCIGPGKLKCKNVYLAALPDFGEAGSETLLKTVVESVLQLASKSSYGSIAMPALGTGYLKYPRDTVARIIRSTTTTFAQDNPSSTLKTVTIVLFYKDHETISVFQNYIRTTSETTIRKNRALTKANPKNQRILQPTGQFDVSSNAVQVRQVRVRVAIGNILEEATDIIVNTVSTDFKFVGAVARQLLKKCPKVEAEFKRKQNKIVRKGVVSTKCRGLKAGHVLHFTFQKSPKEWTNMVLQCLEKGNKMIATSIAFPLFGTGSGSTRLGPETVASCIFDAVEKYTQKHKIPDLHEVAVVIFHTQMHIMMEPVMRTFHKKAQEFASTEASASPSKLSKFTNWIGSFVGGFRQPQIPDKNASVKVMIISDDSQNRQACMLQIDSFLNHRYETQKIDSETALVKKLAREQLAEIENSPFLVDTKIDQTSGVITIMGPKIPVSDAKDFILNILRRFQREITDKEEAELLFKQIRWNYVEVTMNGLVHKEYDKDVNLVIERAYKDNKPSVDLTDSTNNMCFEINFTTMEERAKGADEDVPLQVIRKDHLVTNRSTALPTTWDPMQDKEGIKRVTIKPTDQEYIQLKAEFEKQVKSGGYSHRIQYNLNTLQIDKIERIQNRHLWQQYSVRKQQIEKEKPNLPANMQQMERHLWHGTTPDALDSIITYGFNRSYCGKNGTWYGMGVYFASDASYSARGWLSGVKTAGPMKGYVFSVKAVTGHYTKGSSNMRFLPPIDPKQPLVLYDSAVDNPQNPVEFVIFHDTQSYPEYLISFSAS